MTNCPHCGQPMVASTPAQPPPPKLAPVIAQLVKEAQQHVDSPPSGWRDRDKLT